MICNTIVLKQREVVGNSESAKRDKGHLLGTPSAPVSFSRRQHLHAKKTTYKGLDYLCTYLLTLFTVVSIGLKKAFKYRIIFESNNETKAPVQRYQKRSCR
jgi:hypothetical protein